MKIRPLAAEITLMQKIVQKGWHKIGLKLTFKILINGWFLGLILFLYLWLMTCRLLRNAKERLVLLRKTKG